jgi:hypothetical protein
MIDHRQIEDLLLDFVYGELTEGKAREVQQHLPTCPQCSGEVAKLTGVRTAMSALPRVEPSASVTAAILRRAQELVPKRAPKWSFAQFLLRPSVAGVFLFVLVLGVGLYVARQGREAAPSDSMDVTRFRSRATAPVATPAPAPAPAAPSLPPVGTQPAAGDALAHAKVAPTDPHSDAELADAPPEPPKKKAAKSKGRPRIVARIEPPAQETLFPGKADPSKTEAKPKGADDNKGAAGSAGGGPGRLDLAMGANRGGLEGETSPREEPQAPSGNAQAAVPPPKEGYAQAQQMQRELEARAAAQSRRERAQAQMKAMKAPLRAYRQGDRGVEDVRILGRASRPDVVAAEPPPAPPATAAPTPAPEVAEKSGEKDAPKISGAPLAQAMTPAAPKPPPALALRNNADDWEAKKQKEEAPPARDEAASSSAELQMRLDPAAARAAAEALVLKAETHLKNNEIDKAIETLERLLRVNPGYATPRAYELLVSAYERKGDSRNAMLAKRRARRQFAPAASKPSSTNAPASAPTSVGK